MYWYTGDSTKHILNTFLIHFSAFKASAHQPTRRNATSKYHMIDGQKTTADEQKLVFETPHTSRRDEMRLTPTNKNYQKPFRFVASAGVRRALGIEGHGSLDRNPRPGYNILLLRLIPIYRSLKCLSPYTVLHTAWSFRQSGCTFTFLS